MAVDEELPADAAQEAINELQGIRQSIDNIDAALIHLLAERFKFTQGVGRLKAAHGLPPADPAREFLQIQRLRGLAEEARLDPAFAEKFLNFIIAEVIHHHEKIAGDSVGGARPASSSTPATDAAAAAVDPAPNTPTAPGTPTEPAPTAPKAPTEPGTPTDSARQA